MVDANQYYLDEYMKQQDAIQTADDFENYCKSHAIEIATHYKVHEDLHEDFAEWYHDYMCQNPELFEPTWIMLDDDYIKDWWEENSHMYDDYDEPYIIFKPQIQRSLPEPEN
tara:strand:+ start:247 stop:582 length:336 start_codon:yes stop_codon:yes gene_type:complete